jgi:integrase
MASVSIRRRESKRGARFQVRFRLGGRAYPLVHAGSFETLKEARARRDFVAGELAANRNPAEALRASATQQRRTFREWAKAYKTSRVDIGEQTQRNMDSHIKRLLPAFGDRDPKAISVSDVQEWIGQNADLNPSSFRPYLGTLRLLLDFAGADPNPARDKRVKLPRVELAEIEPPTSEQVEAIVANVKPRWRLPLRTLEQSGMRVGELTVLEWRDVDVAGSRFRIRRGKTAAARRWVAVPAWLMVEIQATCPPDDRIPERRVFQGLTGDSLGNAMERACKARVSPTSIPMTSGTATPR